MIITILLMSIFITFAIFNIKYNMHLKKKYKKNHNLISSLAISINWIIAGILSPFIISEQVQAITLISMSLTIICFVVYIILAKPKKLRYDFDDKKFSQEIRRKLFHLIPPILIILLWNLLGKESVILIGYSLIVLIALIDYARNSSLIKKLPRFIFKLINSAMRKNELYEPLKVVPLVLGLVPALFLPYKLFISVALISSLSDASASILGKLYKKIVNYKIKGKTIIGFVGGFATSYLLTFFATQSIKYSLVGAFTFLIIDLLNLKLDDNFLNPLIITAAFVIV